MTETTVTDGSGCQLSAVLYKGELFSPFPLHAIEKLETFDFRDDDIIISAYPKAVDYGSWFDNMREWETALNTHPSLQVLTLAYEDLKENAEMKVMRLAQFLGKSYDSKFIQSVCDNCKFSSMRERKGQFDTAADGQPIMYRKGQVGDWQNWFTSEQVQQMDDMYRSKMTGSSLSFRYKISDTSLSSDNSKETTI